MSEHMTVYEIADRFATIDREGRVRVWMVDAEGAPREAHAIREEP